MVLLYYLFTFLPFIFQVVQELLGIVQGVKLAHIHQLQVVLLVAHEGKLMAVLQIEVDDAEAVGHLAEKGEHRGPDDVDAAEGEFLK